MEQLEIPSAPPELAVPLSPERSLPRQNAGNTTNLISTAPVRKDYSLNRLFEAQDVLDKRYKVFFNFHTLQQLGVAVTIFLLRASIPHFFRLPKATNPSTFLLLTRFLLVYFFLCPQQAVEDALKMRMYLLERVTKYQVLANDILSLFLIVFRLPD